MTDFYALLKRSILDRGIVDTGERDEIYAQARRAMIRRLWAFDPPLDEEEIEQRIGAFDTAVSDIEAEVMAAFADEAPDAPPEPEGEYAANGEEYPYRADDEADYRPQLPVPARSPRELAQRVREAGVVRYQEEARRVRAYDEPSPGRYDDEQPEDYQDEPPEPGPSEHRRTSEPAPRRIAGNGAPLAPYDAPYPVNDSPTGAQSPEQRGRHDRWSERRTRREVDDLPRRRERRRPEPRPARRPKRRLSDRDKVRILLGAIGIFLVILAGISGYVILGRDGGGVTVDIGVRREVSDAATAARIAAENLPIDQTFMLFDGRDPTIFETSADNPVRYDANAGVVRISSSTGSPGVKALIGPGLATRLAGHEVRVTIVARSSSDFGAAGMRFAYQSGVAISHWQSANLGPDYQAVAIVWRVPALRTDRAGDLLVIQPGIPGDGTGADIKSIRIDLLAS